MLAGLLLLAQISAPPTVAVRIYSIYHPKTVTVTAGDAKHALAVKDGTLVVDGAPVTGAWTLHAPALTVAPGGEKARAYPGTIVAAARGGEIALVDHVDLEDYVAATTAAESPGAPPAAMRAMAILVRTYALRNLQRHADDGADLCDLTHCQVFKGAADPKRDADAIAAAAATKGEILTWDGAPAEVFFSASCGGHGASSCDVWDLHRPYLEGSWDGPKDAPVCLTNPQSRWSSRVPAAKLLAALSAEWGAVGDFQVVKRDEAGRAISIELFRPGGGAFRDVQSDDFHTVVGRALGWAALKSTWFEVHRDGDDYAFTGRGFGHGVGLCQAGAAARARAGDDEKAILAHYFPGTAISSLQASASAPAAP